MHAERCPTCGGSPERSPTQPCPGCAGKGWVEVNDAPSSYPTYYSWARSIPDPTVSYGSHRTA
jgi:hypothetical protein